MWNKPGWSPASPARSLNIPHVQSSLESNFEVYNAAMVNLVGPWTPVLETVEIAPSSQSLQSTFPELPNVSPIQSVRCASEQMGSVAVGTIRGLENCRVEDGADGFWDVEPHGVCHKLAVENGVD